VRFTPRVVNRSWLFDLTYLYLKQYVTRSATGVSEVALNAALDEKTTLVSRQDSTTEARNGVVKRRPHRSFSKGRGNRTD
jgi:hypothetical protein